MVRFAALRGAAFNQPLKRKERVVMKLFRASVAALSAALALAALASPASAVEFLLAEWLVNGEAVAFNLPVEVTGPLTLGDLRVPLIGSVKIRCNAIGIGVVGVDGEDEAREVLNAAREPISLTPLVGLALECVNVEGCPTPLVWPEGLPAKSLLELMVDGTEEFYVDLALVGGAGIPGFEVECMGVVPLTDLCEAEESISLVKNGISDLEVEDSVAFTELSGLKLGSCTEGGAESAFLEGSGLAVNTEGGFLSVS